MLPSILEVATQHGLRINGRSSQSKKDLRCKCPFCQTDAQQKDKFYLSLNVTDNVFKCWACGESGGVLKLIALLEKRSVEEVKRSLWGDTKSSRKPLHPAERLTPSQLKMLGFITSNWGELKQRDPAGYKNTLDWIWREWLAQVNQLKRSAYIGLLTLTDSVEIQAHCQKYADQIGIQTEALLYELTRIKFSHRKPEWANTAEQFVAEAQTGK